jgi:chloramphenicol 3-O-phosphotransferase
VTDFGDAADGPSRPARPPLAVLVSGAPGSGKTTLAAALGVSLDLPVVHKDQLVHGIWRTRDRALELGAPGIEPFYRTMETWAELGVSFVAEQTFVRGVSEPDVARRLATRCVLVNVHCRSEHAVARFERRMRADPLCGEARLLKLMPLAERLQSQLYEPLAMDCPLVVVDTDDGYTPPLHIVIEQIDRIYSRPLTHDLDRPAPEG